MINNTRQPWTVLVWFCMKFCFSDCFSENWTGFRSANEYLHVLGHFPIICCWDVAVAERKEGATRLTLFFSPSSVAVFKEQKSQPQNFKSLPHIRLLPDSWCFCSSMLLIARQLVTGQQHAFSICLTKPHTNTTSLVFRSLNYRGFRHPFPSFQTWLIWG